MQKTDLPQPLVPTEPAGRQRNMHSFHTQLANSQAVQIRDTEEINN